MREKIVALASPHHDPSGRLLTLQRKGVKLLKDIFDTLNVSSSHHTDSRVFNLFKEEGAHSQKRQEEGNVSERYTSALKMAIEHEVDYIFLVDFDRILHWVLNYEDELRTVVEELKQTEGFTTFNRSVRAFETHPLTQRETEVVANDIAARVVGKKVDIMSGGWGMEREVAEVLVKKVHRKDFGYYGEILAVAHKEGFNINGIEVEGLEWETPDQFKEDINKVGYIQWLHNFESLEEWEKRLTLAFEAGSAIQN